MGVEVMFHLRRINFQNHVLHPTNNNNNSSNEKSDASTTAKIEINDGDEPTKIPALRANSTYILLDKSTKIGRNPELVDVVLHSHVHSNMISRSHSEIFLESGSYYISDTSLNGTYVNDYRAPKRRKDEPPYRYKQLLREGDVIKFGHVNGAAINEGEHAPQESADFIFKFERAIPGYNYFGYTNCGERERRDGTRAYMQINSDRVMPYDPYTASPPSAAAIIGVPPPQSQPPAQPQQPLQPTFNGKTLLSQQQQQQLLSQRLAPTNHNASRRTTAGTRSVAAVAPLPATNQKLATGQAVPVTFTSPLPPHYQQPMAPVQHVQQQPVDTIANTAFALNQSQLLKPQHQLQPQTSFSSVLASTLPPQQQQQLAAAVAAAANLNSEELAAQLRQIVASAVTATTVANGSGGSLTAPSASASGTDALAAFNPLFYLQRLQQQNNTAGHTALYNGGLQAAAAAYLNPSNLWSNVNLNAFRNALQPSNNATDWLNLNVSSQPTATANFTPAYSVATSSSVTNSIGNVAATSAAATAAAAVALQQHLRGGTSGYTVPQQQSCVAAATIANCVNTCTPSTSANVFSASNYKTCGISQVPAGAKAAAGGNQPTGDVLAMAAAFLPNTFANLTSQQQQELLAAATAQQQLSKKDDDPSAISQFSNWPAGITPTSTSTAANAATVPPHSHYQHILLHPTQSVSHLQQQQLRQTGAVPLSTALSQQVNGASISQQQQIANVIAAAAAGSNAQIGRDLYSSFLPTTSTSNSGNDLLAAAAQNTVLSRLISPGCAPPTTAAPLNILVASGASAAASSAAASVGSIELVSPTSATSGEPSARIASLKDFADTKFGNVTSIHSLAAKYFDNKPFTSPVVSDQKLTAVGEQTSLLKTVPATTVSIASVKVDRLSALKDAAALLSHDVAIGKTSKNTPNTATVVLPKTEDVKTMECDSSVPSPPKFSDEPLVCGDRKLEETNSPSLSSPSRPCSYQSVPLSPPRAPCPKMDESDADSRISEVIRRSPSNDSLTSFRHREKTADEDTSCTIDRPALNASNVSDELSATRKSSTTGPKSGVPPAKRNEVERLLQDLTAGNCSWMYQASRQNANRRLADSAALGAGVKSLRLDERKKRELLCKKSHKLMRQISDESSDEDEEPTVEQLEQNHSIRREKLKREDVGNTLSSSSSGGESADELAANSTKKLLSQQQTSKKLQPSNKKLTASSKLHNSGGKRSTISTKWRENSRKKLSSSKPAAKRKSSGHNAKPPADSSNDSESEDDGAMDSKSDQPSAKKANRSATKTSTTTTKGRDKVKKSAEKSAKKSKKSISGGVDSSSSGSGAGLIDEWNFHDPERSVCAHTACRKPQDDNVNWAACDACGKWFHTLCALGANVSLGNETDFRCGCRKASECVEIVPPLPSANAIITTTRRK